MTNLSLAKEKEIRALLTKKGREKAQKFLVEGARVITTMIQSGVDPVYFVVSPRHFTNEGENLYSQISSQFSTIYECDTRKFGTLTDTENSQGFLAIVDQSLLAKSDEKLTNGRFFVYLDGISDPGNLGTIVRTAAAFSVDQLFLSSGCAEITNPKTIRSSAGAIFRLPASSINRASILFEQLKKSGVAVIGADSHCSTDIEDLEKFGKLCLVVGSEAAGLSPETRNQCDRLFRIKTAAGVESLNVAAASAIAMYTFSQRIRLR